MRDGSATIATKSFASNSACSSRVRRDRDGVFANFRDVSFESFSEIAHEGGA
jgi:hypothetical protein